MLPEYAEMLSALCVAKVEFVIVGGYAVGIHVEPRATKDIDILVRPSRRNALRVLRALRAFGTPVFDLTARDLATPGLVLQIGVPPCRIDLLTAIDGVSFDEAWASRAEIEIAGLEEPIPFLGRDALIKNKRAARRPQDVADLASLEATRRPARRRPRR